jgi:hypothetical protein
MKSRTSFALAAAILGGALFVGGAVPLFFGYASAGWPVADATIVYSTANTGGRRPDSVDIRYVYRVNGREYKGDRWRYSFFLNRSRTLETSAAQASYPVGTHTTIAVDPDNPARSVLEPGYQGVDLLWVCSGMLIAVVGHLGRRRARVPAPVGAPTGTSPTTSASRSGRHYGLPIAMLLLATLALGLGLERIREGLASDNWPIVDGRVLYSAFGAAKSTGGHPIEIRYEYFLGGIRHVGAYSGVAGREEALSVLHTRKQGDIVHVHYDPAHLGRSAIITGVTWHNLVLPAVALVLLLFAALAKAVADTDRKQSPGK